MITTPYLILITKSIVKLKLSSYHPQGIVKVGAVNADEDFNKELAAQYNVRGFPTVKIFSGGNKRSPSDFNGQRTTKGLIDAAMAEIKKQVEGSGSSSAVDPPQVATANPQLSN